MNSEKALREAIMESPGRCADWKGIFQFRWYIIPRRRKGKWVWSEWGRWCYITNCHGEEVSVWWEPETK